MISLKDDDLVVSVTDNCSNDIFVTTYNGFGLWYDTEEVSVVGIRASGVRAIKLKDDYVVSLNNFDYNKYAIINNYTISYFY